MRDHHIVNKQIRQQWTYII